MKDKTARALAIVALVFMALFIAALVTTLVDHKLLGGGIGYIAICLGVVVLILFLILRADGRGFSMTKINNDIEMEKIEKALEEQEKKEAEEQEKAQAQNESAEQAETEESKDDGQK